MQVANQIYSAGIAVFPCRGNKLPAVDKGESWKDYATLPPSNHHWPSDLVGVPIPNGCVVIDLDTYKGATRESVDALLGCALPWDAALIQVTPQGGQHYAFGVDWVVRFGSSIGGVKGLDTRTTGKGYICTGGAYQPQGFGIYAFAHPSALPRLPEESRAVLEHVALEKTERVALPTNEKDIEHIVAALRFINPECNRREWVKIGLALRSYFHDDEAAGYSMFDQWSCGEFWPDGEPTNYVAEDMEHQWSSFKSEGATAIGSLFYEALDGGWIPPATFDTSGAFGGDGPAASAETFNTLLQRITESGTDISQTEQIVNEIIDAQCNAFQRDLLTMSLKAALKEAKVLDKALSARLDKMLRPDRLPPMMPAQIMLPDVIDIDDLPCPAISRPSGLHGVNAQIMDAEIFGGRIATLHGILRWWSGREWQTISEETLSRITYHALMPDQCKAPNVAGTRSALMALTDKLGEGKRGPLIFFKDCVLNARTGEILAHNAANCNTSSLVVNRTESHTAPNWFAFIDQIFGGSDDGEDRTALLQEIMGWSLLQDDLNVQKIVAFDGASRAGKGIILETLQAIMGGDKCGTVTFADIDDGKTQSAFRRHDVIIDLEAKPPANQSLKKAIGFMNKVASNEAVSIQLLNTQQPWTGRLNCKLIIACNGIPAMLDDSGATTNRFLVLFFTRSFKDKEDRTLLSRLLKETDAIAAWAAQGAHRLIHNGGVFTSPKTSVEALREMKDTNQPLSAFIADYLIFDKDARAVSGEVWAAYRLYCSENNVRLGTQNAFSRSLRRAMLEHPSEYQRTMRLNGKVSSGYLGLRVRDLVVGVPMTAAAFQPSMKK